jgi:hypothetical protein
VPILVDPLARLRRARSVSRHRARMASLVSVHVLRVPRGSWQRHTRLTPYQRHRPPGRVQIPHPGRPPRILLQGPELISVRQGDSQSQCLGPGSPVDGSTQPVGRLLFGGRLDVMSAAVCEGKTYAVVRSGWCPLGMEAMRLTALRPRASAPPPLVRRFRMPPRRSMRVRTSAQATKSSRRCLHTAPDGSRLWRGRRRDQLGAHPSRSEIRAAAGSRSSSGGPTWCWPRTSPRCIGG